LKADQFIKEWEKYLKIISMQDIVMGKELSQEEKEDFSSEQNEKLLELKEEVQKLSEKN
jgi:hypothetical protein